MSLKIKDKVLTLEMEKVALNSNVEDVVVRGQEMEHDMLTLKQKRLKTVTVYLCILAHVSCIARIDFCIIEILGKFA